jgi:hypothetical protein
MVGYVRTDETPHVEYLRTALSELRARTLRTNAGGVLSGRRLVDALLHRTLAALTTSRPRDQRENVRGGLVTAIRVARKGDSLIEQFDALAPDWVPPALTGFEPDSTRS